jgi:hypothetical protein
MLSIHYNLSIKRIEAIIRLKAHEVEYVKVCLVLCEPFLFHWESPFPPLFRLVVMSSLTVRRQSVYGYTPIFFHPWISEPTCASF